MNKGKLLYVAGLFGAGKTTLITAAIDYIPNLHYLITYTTRPKRETEVNRKGEYVFVNEEEYQKYKHKSNTWDEYIFSNYLYGNDIEQINKELNSGKNFILCIAPKIDVIHQMNSKYSAPSTLIWIDTDLDVANERLIKDGRPERITHPIQNSSQLALVKDMAHVVFKPTNNIEEDKANFINLVNDVLKK